MTVTIVTMKIKIRVSSALPVLQAHRVPRVREVPSVRKVLRGQEVRRVHKALWVR